MTENATRQRIAGRARDCARVRTAVGPAIDKTMNESGTRPYQGTDDADEPHENRPLSGPARDEDGREHTAFFETKDRARHAGQWLASTATIGAEDGR